jgi:hypothetical protein
LLALSRLRRRWIYNLSSQPFWLDEALSDAVANSNGMNFIKLAFEREASTAFYYLMLHEWLRLVSPSDFNIRLLSSIFAVGAVVALYVLPETGEAKWKFRFVYLSSDDSVISGLPALNKVRSSRLATDEPDF